MSRRIIILTLSLVAVTLAMTGMTYAQSARTPADDSSYHYGPTTPTPTEPKPNYAQQKARMRAEQRIARLESYRRYGITPNRPTAEALPFTSAYPLMWLRRSTTPMVTFNSYRPLMYYSYPYTLYR